MRRRAAGAKRPVRHGNYFDMATANLNVQPIEANFSLKDRIYNSLRFAVAIVLGPLAEPALRQSLLISNGPFMIFLERPMSAVITVIAALLFLLPLIKIFKARRNRQRTDHLE